MRRLGLLVAGGLLASGAGLALATPASAAVQSGGDRPRHSDCDHGYGDDYYHHHSHHGHHGHGGIFIGIGIGIGIGG
jgi:hypothetical protein